MKPRYSPSTSKKSKTHYSVRVDERILERFEKAAIAEGKRSSEKIRELMLVYLDGQPDFVQVEPDPAKLELVNIRTLLPEFLLAAVEDRAAQKGISRNRWISALVQSNLMKSPVLTESEIQAIQETSRAMVAIGRNLNQIGKALNASPDVASKMKLKEIEVLDRLLKDNRNDIRALVRASRNVWNADNK